MSPSRNDEQIVERYQSVAAFSGSGRGEMTLRDNEVVTVIEKNNTGLLIYDSILCGFYSVTKSTAKDFSLNNNSF